jgi:hypothetical protein
MSQQHWIENTPGLNVLVWTSHKKRDETLLYLVLSHFSDICDCFLDGQTIHPLPVKCHRGILSSGQQVVYRRSVRVEMSPWWSVGGWSFKASSHQRVCPTRCSIFIVFFFSTISLRLFTLNKYIFADYFIFTVFVKYKRKYLSKHFMVLLDHTSVYEYCVVY